MDKREHTDTNMRSWKRDKERLERLNLVLRTIRAVNQLTARIKDRSGLIEGVCDVLTENRGYFNAWIVLLDEAGEFKEVAENGLGKKFAVMTERLKYYGLTECGRKASKQPEIVVTLNPSSACPDCPLAEHYRGRAGFTMRLQHNGKLFGLLSASVSTQFAMDEEEQNLFKEVADDVAFALHDLEVEEERRQAEKDLQESEAKIKEYSEGLERLVEERTRKLRERVRDWKLLYEVTKTVTSSLDMKTVLNSIVEKTVEAMGVKACLIRLLACDEKGEKLEIAAFHGLSDEYFGKGFFYIKDGTIDQAVQKGEVVTILDIHNDPRVHYGEEAKREGIVSSASAPLMLKEKSIGVIRVYTSEPHKFDANELELLTAIAMQAAIAIENTRLYQAKAYAERMAAVGEIAGMVGHDLHNPLQAVVNILSLTKDRLKTLPLRTPALREKQYIINQCEVIEKQIWYMNKIVSDLQDYARPIKPKITPMNLCRLIEETLSSITVPENIKVSIKIKKTLKVMVDFGLMRRVLTNLILNAVQAMPDGGRLNIKANERGEATVISIQDTGTGIKEEDLPMIFKPLFTTKSKGMGFGLAVCKRLVQAHNGSITVKSKIGEGSTFTVNLPTRKEGEINK